MKKPDEGKRDQNKRRGNKRLRTSPRLSKELISSSIHSINNNDYGRLVWGKIPGSRTWPGIIINHVTCGMDPPSEKSVWIFWFGDNRISLGVISKTYDFVSNFAKFFSLRNAPATFRRGILDMLIECRRRAGLHLARNESELGSLVKWAEGEFQNPSKSLSVFMPYEEIQLPEKVLKQIERIKSAQAQSGDNGGLRAGELDQFPTSSSSSESDSDTEERRIWRSKAVLLKQARVGKACLDSFCIGCEKGEEEGMVVPHPLFQGGLCGSCKVEFDGCFGSSGMDGINFFCAVCSSPGEVLVCDNEQCDRVFCVGCIELYVAPSAVDKIKSTDPWLCFLCSDYNPKSHGLLVPRPEWINERNEKLIADDKDEDYYPDDDFPDTENLVKRPLRVLSLFDGIGTGFAVLEKLNLQLDRYFASEIDSDAINVSKINFGSKITHLGDIENCSDKEIEAMCPIDLLIGGSPCNDLSAVNPNRKGLYDPTGTGILFFHFFRIQKVIQKQNGGRHLFWFYENVASMPKECKKKISLFLQRKPIVLDAKYFSPQKRARFYWGNIPDMYKPLPEAITAQDHTLKQSLLEECNRSAQVEKLNCITTNPNSLTLKNGLVYPITMNGRPDVPWITEIEKVFGFPAHYTDVGNLGVRERQALLGRAWCVQVITHLFSPLGKYFLTHEEALKETPEGESEEMSNNNNEEKSQIKV